MLNEMAPTPVASNMLTGTEIVSFWHVDEDPIDTLGLTIRFRITTESHPLAATQVTV